MRQLIAEALPGIIKIRHHIHQHPELSFDEHQTSEYISNKLKELGYIVQNGLATTGVTAVLDSGKPGKTVGLRADIDALPLQEKTDLIFKSKHMGKMHACGHDGHIATLLLVADILRSFKTLFCGKIKFIFQPAEEVGRGAKEMIKQGVLQNPAVDAIFGYHNLPTFSKNQILVKPECIMAGRMVLRIKIIGLGGHSSTPEKTVDPIYVGSCVVQMLHSMRSRNFSAFDKIVISVTKFNAGTAENIIPSDALLEGTIRFTTNDSIDYIQNIITQGVESLASSLGARAEINFPEIAPATMNSPREAELVKRTALTLFGQENVVAMKDNIMASEDFAFFLEQIPGCFFLIGTGTEKCYLHNPHYTFEDDIIPVAAELLATTAINYLNDT